MATLTDAMTAALENLKSQLTAGGLTAEQVTAQIHSVVDTEVQSLKDAVAAIQEDDKGDDEKLADVVAAVSQFTSTFAPAPAPEEAPQA